MTDKKDLQSFDFDIMAVNAPWYDGIEILITGIDVAEYSRADYAFTLDNSPMRRNPGERSPETLVISREAGERLMNQLWHCGLRPTEVGSAGQLKATENHLADMRQLTFYLLKRKSAEDE